VLDAIRGNGDALVREGADLLYNLDILWAALGIRPKDIWRENGPPGMPVRDCRKAHQAGG